MPRFPLHGLLASANFTLPMFHLSDGSIFARLRAVRRFVKATGRAGFTLVELLVTMAITSLMLALLTQISGSTLQSIHLSRQHLNAAQSTRVILDALEADFSNAVVESGLSIVVAQDEHHNSHFAFLSRQRGPDVSGSDPSRFLAVSYQPEANTIKRKIAPITWDILDLMGAMTSTFSSTLSNELGNGVVRFEAVAVLASGTTVSLSQPGSWKTTSVNGQPLATPYSALVLRDPLTPSPTTQQVRSIVVAVAVLDEAGLKIPDAKNLGADLPSPAAGQTPLEAWNAALASGALSKYPRPILGSLRIDQRTFNLK